ncbi:MAG: glycerophosphodiester phosphodiesterase family protein, partial [Pseudomonadota bacterium]|nr:glycerophosphodiester phosphodiesterase family protein [Pseudomonadota bacterium]
MGEIPTLSRISGHRGAPSLAPENTLASFEAARQAGAGWTETDVCLLGDGTAVMFHDDSLDRCTDRSGSIQQLTRADLAQVNANRQFPDSPFTPIPTLAEALIHAEATGMGLNIELKRHDHVTAAALVEAVVPVLRQHPLKPGQLMLSSFDFDALRLARAAMVGVAMAVIAEDLSDEVITVAHEIGAHSLNLWWETLRQDLVAQALDEGFQVNVWTVNDPALAPALFDWG